MAQVAPAQVGGEGENGGGVKKEVGASVLPDSTARWQVVKVTVAVLVGAMTYIVMSFTALPVSVHLIVNKNNGCNTTIETCFVATEASQRELTSILTVLRVCTLMCGSLMGAVSDRYGRRPCILAAQAGYMLAALLFMLGWSQQSLAPLYAGAAVLGMASPIAPHGYAYVSDVSAASSLASNLGILQGLGYFVGLMCGAFTAAGLATVSLTSDPPTEEQYSELFKLSYGLGLLATLVAFLVVFASVPESLHASDRARSLDLSKANPLGFVVMVTKNRYIFFTWLAALSAWSSVGASEAVTGGWWMRRFVKTSVSDFVLFTAIVWVCSGLGAVVMTKLYVATIGLKKAIHLTMLLSIASGVVLATSQSAQGSLAVAPVAGLSSPLNPLLLALLLGQVGPLEKGQLAGAVRSSEALGKIIGVAAFGNAFASYIAPYTPDESCVPPEYSPSNGTNSCDCGVETCPIIVPNPDPMVIKLKFLPKLCKFGALSTIAYGAPSKKVPFLLPDQEGRPILPDAIVKAGNVARSVEGDNVCLGSGLAPDPKGFALKMPRLWCISTAVGISRLGEQNGPAMNTELGCPGFDLQRLPYEKMLKENGARCMAGSTPCDEDLLAEGMKYLSGEKKIVNSNPCAAQIFYAIKAQVNPPSNACVLPDPDNSTILPNATCGLHPANSTAVAFNVCLAGVLTDTPGLFILLIYAALPAAGWLMFIIAEALFVKADAKFWAS